MNLSLLDPFQNDFPEVIEEYLEHGTAKCIAFNRRGTLLAAGCTDGTCVIWDFVTRGVAKELHSSNPTATLTSVSWSKCGRRLLTSATDKSVTLWDVTTGTEIASMNLQQTTLLARLYPGCSSPCTCLACPMSNPPVLVNFESRTSHTLPVSVAKGCDSNQQIRSKPSNGNTQFCPSAATFNKSGDLVYVGNIKGEVLIIETDSREVRAVVPVPGGAFIRQLVFSRSGHQLLIISSDRAIRVFENLLPKDSAASSLAQIIEDLKASRDHKDINSIDLLKQCGSQCLELSKELQDKVNRVQWKAACFSGDGEYIAGASQSKGEHKIYVWNKFGQWATILEGPKEGLIDIAWHPSRPIVASLSMSAGVIYIWAKDYTENWSAFAPDFKELEENEEYVEREDEFDIKPETGKIKPAKVDEDEIVDIMTADKVASLSDSDDSDDGLHFLPVTLLPDTPGQQNLSIHSSEGTPKLEHSIVPASYESNFGAEADRAKITDATNVYFDDERVMDESDRGKRTHSAIGEQEEDDERVIMDESDSGKRRHSAIGEQEEGCAQKGHFSELSEQKAAASS